MNAKLKAATPDIAITLTKESLNLAGLAESWVNGRIAPMVEAIAALGSFSSEIAHQSNTRIKLIRDLAVELGIMVDEAGACFARELREFEEKLEQLEGGAQ